MQRLAAGYLQRNACELMVKSWPNWLDAAFEGSVLGAKALRFGFMVHGQACY